MRIRKPETTASKDSDGNGRRKASATDQAKVSAGRLPARIISSVKSAAVT